MPHKVSWRSNTQVHYSITAYEVNQQYYFDGFQSMVIEGLQRRGKSSYSIKCFANAFGKWEFKPFAHVVEPSFEDVKPWLTFMPKEYLDLIMDVNQKVRGLILDDAGLWLYALDWYDPFVKAVNKWLQVCATRFGTVLLTTPNKNLISSKIMDALPEMKVCRVIKDGVDRPKFRPRLAKVYEKWDYPDGKKGGVKSLYSDKFNAILPDSFYEWYAPKRDAYLNLAVKLLQSEIVKINKVFEKRKPDESAVMTVDDKIKMAIRESGNKNTQDGEDVENIIHKAIGEDSNFKELDEVLQSLEGEMVARNSR